MQKGWPTHGSCDIICGWKLLNLFNYAAWLLFVLFIPYHYHGENTPRGVQVNFPKETYSSDPKKSCTQPSLKNHQHWRNFCGFLPVCSSLQFSNMLHIGPWFFKFSSSKGLVLWYFGPQFFIPFWRARQTSVLHPTWQARQTSVLHPIWQARQTSVLHPVWRARQTSVLHPIWRARQTSVLHPIWRARQTQAFIPSDRLDITRFFIPFWRARQTSVLHPIWQDRQPQFFI